VSWMQVWRITPFTSLTEMYFICTYTMWKYIGQSNYLYEHINELEHIFQMFNVDFSGYFIIMKR
jgi:hypothetical protein